MEKFSIQFVNTADGTRSHAYTGCYHELQELVEESKKRIQDEYECLVRDYNDLSESEKEETPIPEEQKYLILVLARIALNEEGQTEMFDYATIPMIEIATFESILKKGIAENA